MAELIVNPGEFDSDEMLIRVSKTLFEKTFRFDTIVKREIWEDFRGYNAPGKAATTSVEAYKRDKTFFDWIAEQVAGELSSGTSKNATNRRLIYRIPSLEWLEAKERAYRNSTPPG